MKLTKLLDVLPGKGRVMEVLVAIGIGFSLCLAVLLWMEKRENGQLRDRVSGLANELTVANTANDDLKIEIEKQTKKLRLAQAIAKARQQDIVRLRMQIEASAAERRRLADKLRATKGGTESPITEEVWKSL
ncbi:MAG: hypothetical protein INF91_00285 [Alphaproteobacteria bacterium]|nr:hypothetical protein [Alphaproteobacteria bacterium]